MKTEVSKVHFVRLFYGERFITCDASVRIKTSELCECKVNQFCFAEQGKVTFVADLLICIFTLNTFV